MVLSDTGIILAAPLIVSIKWKKTIHYWAS